MAERASALAPACWGAAKGFVPHLTPPGVIRQPFHLVAQAVAIEPLASFHDAGMQGAPPFLEETPVCHLVRQGVLEAVGRLGKQAGLVEEFGGLQARQTTM